MENKMEWLSVNIDIKLKLVWLFLPKHHCLSNSGIMPFPLLCISSIGYQQRLCNTELPWKYFTTSNQIITNSKLLVLYVILTLELTTNTSLNSGLLLAFFLAIVISIKNTNVCYQMGKSLYPAMLSSMSLYFPIWINHPLLMLIRLSQSHTRHPIYTRVLL